MRSTITTFVTFSCLNFVFIISSQFNLTIIHSNDIHSRIFPATNSGDNCERSQDVGCFGGIPRIVYKVCYTKTIIICIYALKRKVKQLRKQTPNVLHLNAGDNFVGNLWYSFYRWHIWAEVVSYLMFDAMSFGNHEFDKGIDGVAYYVQNISAYTTTLACNLDASHEPRLRGFFKKSKLFRVNGRKIGVIGYILPKTTILSTPGPTVKFSDEIKSIQKEVDNFKKINVNIIIAVGHSGIAMDKEIARNVPDVDVIVGGHTHAFLYTGKPPSTNKPLDAYPIVINHSDKRKSLVVQAYTIGKYLGFLNVVFDEHGYIKQFSGNPILLDHTVPEDEEVRKRLQPKADAIKQKYDVCIGLTKVSLKNSCRRQECKLGNMITDAMIYYMMKYERCCDTSNSQSNLIAIMNSQSIKASIVKKSNFGDILAKDIMRVSPFDDTISILSVPGKLLKDVFEHSVSRYETADGVFLQVSGIRVKYNLLNPIGHRVVSIDVRCSNCQTPKFSPVSELKNYKLVTSNYLARGNEGYLMLRTLRKLNLDKLLTDVIMEYIKTHSPISPEIENRLNFVN